MISEWEKAMKAVTQSFVAATHQVKIVVEMMLSFLSPVIEDQFVERKGIARSDIRKIVKIQNGWEARLYNGRKVYIDLREL